MVDLFDDKINTIFLEVRSDPELVRKGLSQEVEEFISLLGPEDLLKLKNVPESADKIVSCLNDRPWVAEYLSSIASFDSISYRLLYILVYAYQILQYSAEEENAATTRRRLILLIMMMVDPNDKLSSIVF